MDANPATAQMFVVNPLSGDCFARPGVYRHTGGLGHLSNGICLGKKFNQKGEK